MPVVVLSTVGSDFDAGALARALVDARLAACVNIIDRVRSVYRWQDRIEDEAEQLLVIKTSGERVEALRAELMRLHPYEVPEFVVLQMDDVSEAYRAWLVGSV